MKQKIKIVGLGWAGVGFIQHINTDIYDIEVFSLDSTFVYTPLLAQNIKQSKTLTIIGSQIKVSVTYTNREISDVDFTTSEVVSKSGEKYRYDYLVLSHGASINTFNISGVDTYCYFLKKDFHAKVLREKLQALPAQSRIAVIGCGLTGSEVIGSLLDYNKFKIHAIDGLSRPITMFDEKLSNMVIRLWKVNEVDVNMNQIVSSISDKNIQLKNNKEIPYDVAIWCGGVKKSTLTNSILSKLNLNNNRGIPVNKTLQVENTSNAWAIGDCAFSGLPPTAQVAYQQGTYLAKRFNNNFKHSTDFHFNNNGQIGYIGKHQSVCQLPYFQAGGNLIYYLNKCIHIYNGVNWKQKLHIFKD
jgi:NADH:ubiquinone reductase (non-electrogenic)